MSYLVEFTVRAQDHLLELKRSGQVKTLKKIYKLLEELAEHPTTGTGKVEQLRGDLAGLWSRRIDKGARMIYRIEDERIVVTVISLRGHYGDK